MSLHRDLAALLSSKEMVLVCGSGGVGKTTTAAAMAAGAAADIGGRVLVLTVDPARRLADALGIGALGNEARRIPDETFVAAGVEPRGELWAAMLDTKAGWDELIARHAPDERTREAVLANPLYQNLTRRFVNSHDYLAMEKLHELHVAGEWDLIIVDTPPSRNALDFLDAPRRMREFFGSTLLRWLTVPYRSRLFTVASKPFYRVADSVLGSNFLRDIADFFMLFQQMERGFVDDARQVEQLLVDPRSTFIVVSTLEAAPTYEAGYLARALTSRGYHLGAILANRVMPVSFTSRSALTSANKLKRALSEDGRELAKVAAKQSGTKAKVLQKGLMSAADQFADVAVIAAREVERLAELQSLAPLTVTAPLMEHDVNDVGDLLSLSGRFTAARSPR